MENYKNIENNGDGSYGTVTKVINTKTGEIFSTKTMKQKFQTWNECLELRELKTL